MSSIDGRTGTCGCFGCCAKSEGNGIELEGNDNPALDETGSGVGFSVKGEEDLDSISEEAGIDLPMGGFLPDFRGEDMAANLTLNFLFCQLEVANMTPKAVLGAIFCCSGGNKIVYEMQYVIDGLQAKGIPLEVIKKILFMKEVSIDEPYMSRDVYVSLMYYCEKYYHFEVIIKTLNLMIGISDSERIIMPEECEQDILIKCSCSKVKIVDNPTGIAEEDEDDKEGSPFNRFMIGELLMSIPWKANQEVKQVIKQMKEDQKEAVLDDIERCIFKHLKESNKQTISAADFFKILKVVLHTHDFEVYWRAEMEFLIAKIIPTYDVTKLDVKFFDFLVKICVYILKDYKKGESVFEALHKFPVPTDFSLPKAGRFTTNFKRQTSGSSSVVLAQPERRLSSVVEVEL